MVIIITVVLVRGTDLEAWVVNHHKIEIKNRFGLIRNNKKLE